MTGSFGYKIGRNGPLNRVSALMDKNFSKQAVDANAAEDLRCLAAECVYGSEESSLEAYAELDGRLHMLNMHVPYFFRWLGKLGERASERVTKRKVEQFDRIVNNSYKRAGSKGLMELFRRTEIEESS